MQVDYQKYINMGHNHVFHDGTCASYARKNSLLLTVLHRGRLQEVLTSGYPWVAKM